MELQGMSIIMCHLCMQTCNTPKSLPCLHAFCEVCLDKWIVSKVTKHASKLSFKCPICRTEIEPPIGSTINNVSQWASLYPDDRLIQSCIDRDEIRRRTKRCDICKVNSILQKAEYWCRQCCEGYCDVCKAIHQSMKNTKSHEIVPMSHVLMDLSLINPHESCSKHPDEDIRLFCIDHDTPCCALCSMIDHRNCENVSDLHDAAKHVKTKQEYLKHTKVLRKSVKEIQNLEYNINKNIVELTQKRSQLETSAEKIVNRICNQMVGLLNDYKTKLGDIHTKAVEELTTAREGAMGEHMFVSNVLNRHENSSISDEQIFLHMKRAMAKHREITEKKKHSEHLLGKTLKHDERASIHDLMWECLSIDSLGEVTVVNMDSDYTNAKTPPYSMLWRHEMTKWAIDSREGGVVQNATYFHSDNCILIACFHDKKICSYNSTGQLTSVVAVSHNPFAVAIFGFEILVSFPETKTVAVFELKLGNMIGGSRKRFDIQKTCYGIVEVPHRNTIALVCDDSLAIIDAIKGMKMDEIQLDTDGYRHVTVDRALRAFVTNPNIHRVLCVDLRRNYRLFTFTDYPNLKYPCGISLNNFGNVCVVGCLSKNLLEITNEGKLEDVVLSLNDGLYHPNDIAFKKDSNDFIVTNDVFVVLYTCK